MKKMYEQIRVYGGLDSREVEDLTESIRQNKSFKKPTIQSIVGLEFVYSGAQSAVDSVKVGATICQSLAGDGVICYAPKKLREIYKALQSCKQLSLKAYCKCYSAVSQKYVDIVVPKAIEANEISTKKFKELLREYLKEKLDYSEFGERVIGAVDTIPEEK